MIIILLYALNRRHSPQTHNAGTSLRRLSVSFSRGKKAFISHIYMYISYVRAWWQRVASAHITITIELTLFHGLPLAAVYIALSTRRCAGAQGAAGASGARGSH